MSQARALLVVGALSSLLGGGLLLSAGVHYADTRERWRADARGLGSASYDARTSDRHYQLAEEALERARTLCPLLGLGLLLASTGLAGRGRWVSSSPSPSFSVNASANASVNASANASVNASANASANAPEVSPARALLQIWLEALLVWALWAATRLLPADARLSAALAGTLLPWLLASLLAAPAAAGSPLMGRLLGTRLRDAFGHAPSPMRALATLPLLPLSWLSAIAGLPVHLLLLALRRHPGAPSVTPHTALLGLRTIRWRPAPRTA